MVQYEYFGPGGKRRSVTYSDHDAALQIGERVLTGFDVVQRWFITPDGSGLFVTYCQWESTGRVWALYF